MNDRNIRIAFFAPDVRIHEDQDGQATHIRELLTNWSDFGVEVVLICRSDGNVFADSENVSVRTTNDINQNGIREITTAFSGVFTLTSVLRNTDVDLIYARNGYSIFSQSVALLFDTPHVVEVNSILTDEFAYSDVTLREVAAHAIERSYRFSDHVITVTEGIADTLEEMYGIEQSSAIYNGVNTSLFSPTEELSQGNNGDGFRVCFVGHLLPWQGLDCLIEAAQIVDQQTDHIEFVIVGDGEEREHLEQTADELGLDETIEFVGSVPYEQVPEYINTADVCVAPKEDINSEWSPLKVYEYLACGKPVVATDLDGLGFIKEHNIGWLFEPEDAEEFADVIIAASQEQNLREMGERGRNYVENNHTWGETAKSVLAKLKHLV